MSVRYFCNIKQEAYFLTKWVRRDCFMGQLKAIFGFSSNMPSESGKLSHRNENYCKEEEKPAWVWRRVARRCICCQGKGKSHSRDRLGNSHSQVGEEQFQDQLPYRWTLGAVKHSPDTKDLCLLAHWLLLAWVKTLLEAMRLRNQPCQISTIM